MKTKILTGCFCTLIAVSSLVNAEVYKSVDSDGNTRYSDTPPSNTSYKSVATGNKSTNVVAKSKTVAAKTKPDAVAAANGSGAQKSAPLALGSKAGSASSGPGAAGGGSAGGAVAASSGSVAAGGGGGKKVDGGAAAQTSTAGSTAAKTTSSSVGVTSNAKPVVATTNATPASTVAATATAAPAAAAKSTAVTTPAATAASAASTAAVKTTVVANPAAPTVVATTATAPAVTAAASVAATGSTSTATSNNSAPTTTATSAPVVKTAAPVASQLNAGGLPTVFFGLHLHRADSSTKWPDAQFGSWRLWDSKWRWSKIEPAKNVYDFSMSDKLINLAVTHKVEPLVTLGITPAWASSRPLEGYVYGAGGAAEPKDNKDWEGYLTTIANRYKGKVKYYEVWNEPKFSDKEPVVDKANRALGFYTGSSQKLVELSCSTSKVLKSIDPSIKVLSPGFTGIGDRVSIFLDEGGKDCVDVVAFHFYRDTPEIMFRDMKYIQGLMLASGAGGKELWATENGYDYIGIYDPNKKVYVRKLFDPKQDMDVLASYIPRNFVLAASAGVSRYFFYSWERILTNNETTNTAAADNLGVTYRWLVGAKVGACATSDKKVWTCPLTRNGRKAWMVWDVTGDSTWQPPSSYGVKSYETMVKGDTQIQNGTVDIGQTPILLKMESNDWVL